MRVPKCPNCNVDLVPVGDFVVEVPLLGVIDPPPVLYVCQNPDSICGHFTIFGRKQTTDPPPAGELEA